MSNYQLADPLAITKNRNSKVWKEIDISSTNLIDVFAKYQTIIVAIKDLFDNQYSLNLKHYELELKYYPNTISQWLADLGANALTHLMEGYPKLTLKSAKYVAGASIVGTIKLSAPNVHPTQDTELDLCSELFIKYDRVDMEKLSRNTLWSVNGYYLPHVVSSGGIRIKEAGNIIQKTSATSFGFLDFSHIGKVVTKPITKDMIYKVDETTTSQFTLYIDAKENIADKTIGICIGGYLHLLDGTIKTIAQNKIAMQLGKFDLSQRIIESTDILNLSWIGVDDLEHSINSDKLKYDNIINQYLTTAYSFLVIIDNPNMFKQELPIDVQAALGTIVSEEKYPPSRLTTASGKAVDYWYHSEAGLRCMQHREFFQNNYTHLRSKWRSNLKINNARINTNPYRKTAFTHTQYLAKV